MNIQQFWPETDTLFEPTTDQILDLIRRRLATYCGFASLEQTKGVLRPTVNLNTSIGQEALRVLMFRVIEEATESYMATDPDHVKEEAIDAINYLWSIFVIDPGRYTLPEVASVLTLVFTQPAVATRLSEPPVTSQTLSAQDIGDISIWLSGDVGDMLRNRAWMNNSQSIYFEGTKILELSILRVTRRLMKVFSGFDEFCRFYLAKDDVLQFRIRSHY